MNDFFSRTTILSISVTVLLFAGVDGLVHSDDIDFEKDIWPIFVNRCNECHSGEMPEGQLRLDAKSRFQAGGVSGTLVGKNKDESSLLLERLLGQGDLDRMPLDQDPLTPIQIEKIRKWIANGATWPQQVGVQLREKKKHWAYVPPVRTRVEFDPGDKWSRNPVDRFVLKKMAENGLKPSRVANRGKLLRRLYLDLVGLPPNLDAFDRFVNDRSVNAYEKVVDRLLASPMFGEKWSRAWLDLARYADTNGFQADQFRSIWPYRDWVINAMNNDVPFDQFTIEQLAGDLVPNATLQQKIATGFHRLTTCNVEAGVDPEENRVNQIIDRINTTGTVWLGTTLECMQCHNHKYDPFTQREYYEMFAFFNNTPLEVKNSGNNITYEFFGPSMDLPLSKAKQVQANSIKNEIAELGNQLSELRNELLGDFDEWIVVSRQEGFVAEQWVPLKVNSFESRGGAQHQVLEDQSVLLSGKNPDKDFYTLVVETELPEVNGFKFETLSHPSLPKNGPGRHVEGGRPNFVVYEVVCTIPGQGEKQLKLQDPIADFSQSGFPVAGLVDGKTATGWAINPKFGVDHWASVLIEDQIGNPKDKTRFQFTFDQHYGGGRNIGRLRVLALVGQRKSPGLPEAIKKLLGLKKLNPKQKTKLEDFYLSKNQRFSGLKQRIADTRKKLENVKPATTLVMVESEKRMTRVFNRGNFLDRGEKVTTGTPTALHAGKKSPGQNRLDFAKWIVDAENPLTARVVVNRWWTEIFGRGIVVTGEDFGTQGEPPSHPQLLDWLAVELVESGWSRKKILKSMVMSSTYRQSSNTDRGRYLKDPKNRFLSRGPRFRMSAETIRDHFLVAAGHFSSKMGGPPVYPPQPDGIWRHVGRNAPKYNTSQGTDRYRRGIYVFWRRSAPYPSFVNFDAPDRAACVVNRAKTNTPLQALTLLNDEAFSELHLLFAKQLQASSLPTRDRLADAFRSCTMRQPTPLELGFLESFWNSRLQVYRQELVKATEVAGQRPDAARIAAWVSIVQVLFNLDESITKD